MPENKLWDDKFNRNKGIITDSVSIVATFDTYIKKQRTMSRIYSFVGSGSSFPSYETTSQVIANRTTGNIFRRFNCCSSWRHQKMIKPRSQTKWRKRYIFIRVKALLINEVSLNVSRVFVLVSWQLFWSVSCICSSELCSWPSSCACVCLLPLDCGLPDLSQLP